MSDYSTDYPKRKKVYVNPNRPKPSTPNHPPKPRVKEPSENLVGKNVIINFVDSHTAQANIARVARYEILLDTGEVLFKHDISSIFPVNESSDQEGNCFPSAKRELNETDSRL